MSFLTRCSVLHHLKKPNIGKENFPNNRPIFHLSFLFLNLLKELLNCVSLTCIWKKTCLILFVVPTSNIILQKLYASPASYSSWFVCGFWYYGTFYPSLTSLLLVLIVLLFLGLNPVMLTRTRPTRTKTRTRTRLTRTRKRTILAWCSRRRTRTKLSCANLYTEKACKQVQCHQSRAYF